jgi:hypothetical protein
MDGASNSRGTFPSTKALGVEPDRPRDCVNMQSSVWYALGSTNRWPKTPLLSVRIRIGVGQWRVRRALQRTSKS